MSRRWKLGGKLLDCSRPRVMAIVNATPDSFFAGSRMPRDAAEAADAIAELLSLAPDVVDVGGQSTRPGSKRVPAAEELDRVIPVIQRIRELDGRVPITIDTYSAEVAREALAAGADGVNDISGALADDGMLPLLAESDCGYVLMHMLGTPETMQQDPQYDDCTGEIFEFLANRMSALGAAGVAPERVVLDPGIGFGKTLEHNLELIEQCGRFASLGRPLLYGVSRKSFIGRLGGAGDPAERLAGTLGVTWRLLDQGVMLHRLHDVAPAKQLFAIWEALEQTRQESEFSENWQNSGNKT
ncbi:MAG TPA: dihydropteroate synthase [Firmicutes bacterium]|nr:dihydropteroate synthase [Bacillota bacterium]